MEVKACPHCNNPVPPEFAVMPVCTICGGDLSSQPATQTWATLDINEKKTYQCPNCQTPIESVLITECPSCHAALQLATEGSGTGSSPTMSSIPEVKIPVETVASVSHTKPAVKEGFFTKLLKLFGFK